ncbi:MAG: superoxide dismutase family protein [Sphingopyxis sp.]
MLRFSPILAAMLLCGCSTMSAEREAAHAASAQGVDTPTRASALSAARGAFRMADGHHYGSMAMVRQAADGSLQLVVTMLEFPQGIYGMHIHAVGRCDAPGFTSAGPHWNPTLRQHGRLNPSGAHSGDMPNLTVSERGIAYAEMPLRGELTGEGGLLDADGAAVVIHASADDERTDPSGNSGTRIACAVLTLRGQPEEPAQ